VTGSLAVDRNNVRTYYQLTSELMKDVPNTTNDEDLEALEGLK